MTEAIRTWPDALFYLSDSDDAYDQIVKLQGAAKRVRALSDAATVDSNGDVFQDRLQGLSLGDQTTRHKYRIRYDALNDRIHIQRNAGTDAAKDFQEIFRIDSSGNLLAQGTLSADSLTTTAGGVTLGGTLDANDFYLRNLDKNVGLLRTDSLLVYGSSDLRGSVDFTGVTTFYGKALKTLAFRDNVSNTHVVASAGIERSKIAAGSTNRLVYNAAVTGLLADLGALSGSLALATDANGLPTTVAGLTTTILGYLTGITSDIQAQINALSSTFKYLQAYAPSGSASIDITSIITSTYPYYLFLYDQLFPTTDDSELRMLTDDANGASWDTAAGSYEFLSILYSLGGAAVTAQGSGSAVYAHLQGESAAGGAVDNSVNGASGILIWIRDAALGIHIGRYENSVGNLGISLGTVKRLSGTPNAIQIYWEGGGNFTGGTLRAYGIKDA